MGTCWVLAGHLQGTCQVLVGYLQGTCGYLSGTSRALVGYLQGTCRVLVGYLQGTCGYSLSSSSASLDNGTSLRMCTVSATAPERGPGSRGGCAECCRPPAQETQPEQAFRDNARLIEPLGIISAPLGIISAYQRTRKRKANPCFVIHNVTSRIRWSCVGVPPYMWGEGEVWRAPATAGGSRRGRHHGEDDREEAPGVRSIPIEGEGVF